jgi:hypothetical protein
MKRRTARRWVTGLVLGSAAIGSGTAAADSYRNQLIIADLSTYAAFAADLAIEGRDSTRAQLISIGYLLGPIIIHSRHGHPDRAGESVGLRLGLPLGAGLVGCAIGSSLEDSKDTGDDHGWEGPRGCVIGGVLGAAVGLVGALALDYTSLSEERDESSPLTMSFSGAF